MTFGRRTAALMRAFNVRCGITPDLERPSKRYGSVPVDGPAKGQDTAPHWERMLKELATLVPPGYQVLVLTDRGMYSPRLFGCLVSLGWHPFLRIRAQGFWRPIGSRRCER